MLSLHRPPEPASAEVGCLSYRPAPASNRIPRLTRRTGSGFHASDGAPAHPRLGVIGDAREQPAQLDRRSELAAPVERGTGGGGFGLGDGEHAGSMGSPDLAPYASQ